MHDLFKQGWPELATQKNESALKTSAYDTYHVMRSLLEAAKRANDQQLTNIIQQGAKSILHCTTVNELDLEQASTSFLKLATNIETLLSDLWLENKRTITSSDQEETLSSRMGKMTLALDFVK
jgi:hypothetical protein